MPGVKFLEKIVTIGLFFENGESVINISKINKRLRCRSEKLTFVETNKDSNPGE